MLRTRQLFCLVAVLALFTTAQSQSLESEDVDLNVIELSKLVHFRDPSGAGVQVPAGSYWVLPGDGALDLFSTGDGDDFTVAATASEHSEDIEESMVLSTPGTEEQPDVHSVAYFFADGTQLAAEGTYSGIQPRGRLADAARKRAAQARANAQKRRALARAAAAKARRVAQQAAEAARKKAQQASANIRAKARSDVGRTLKEVAETGQSQGRDAAIRQFVRYAPRLAAGITASFTPAQRQELIRAGMQELTKHQALITEVVHRLRPVAQVIYNSGGKPTPAQRKAIRAAVIGTGDNMLVHPYARNRVTTRGGPAQDFSWSVAAGGEVSAIAGGVIGTSLAMPFSLQEPGICWYISAGVDSGAQGEAEGTVGVGFHAGSYDSLGVSSLQTWLDGFEVAVNLGATVGGGVDATVLVGFSKEWFFGDGPLHPRFSGIQVGPAGGAAAEAAVGLSYGVRIGCTPTEYQ